jgi:hypothetical protein
VLIDSDSEDKTGIREKGGGRETRHNMFIVLSVRSIVSLDSVAASADFIELSNINYILVIHNN